MVPLPQRHAISGYFSKCEMADSPTFNTTAALEPWPGLPLNEWQATYATLHMWTQIVEKSTPGGRFPDALLLEFLQSSYEAARLGNRHRSASPS